MLILTKLSNSQIIKILRRNYYGWNHDIIVHHRIYLATIIFIILFLIAFFFVSAQSRQILSESSVGLTFIMITMVFLIPVAQLLSYDIPNHPVLDKIQTEGYLSNISPKSNTAHTYCYYDKKSIKMLPIIQKESKKLTEYHQKLIDDDYYALHSHIVNHRVYYRRQYDKYQFKYQKLKKQVKHNRYTLHFVINYKAPHLIL